MASQGADPKLVVEEEEAGGLKPQDVVVELPGDTASSSSSRGEHDENDSEGCDEESEDEGEAGLPMPLLSYSRLFGSLPRRIPMADAEPSTQRGTHKSRHFSIASTCSVMGKVILSQQDPSTTPVGATTTTAASSGPNAVTQLQASPGDALLLSNEPHFVMAFGYVNGSVDLLDANTAIAVVAPQQLRLRESTHHQEEAVVAISMDSSGSFLAAIDRGRMAAVWEIQYMIALSTPSSDSSHTGARHNNTQTPPSQQPNQQMTMTASSSSMADSGVFSTFMSALTGGGPTAANSPMPTSSRSQQLTNTHPATATTVTTTATKPTTVWRNNLHPRLRASSVQTSRISYPRSFGVPTCLAIDPSYSRKRDKAVLVGFLDGRLVLTKRGIIFQRRTDAIIYQGTYHEKSSGIEAIEWRGSLAAWADASGIRLFDTDTLTRIAHIDRPTGARLSLYPTLSFLRPILRFETSNYLLVAWGDCLMGLSITDHGRLTVADDVEGRQQTPGPGHPPPPPPTTRRRTVECRMAWELDCVAAGVVPLDADHVLLLGLVAPSEGDEKIDALGSGMSSSEPANDLELQIIAKADGSILFSNILPLMREDDDGSSARNTAEITQSAGDYTLLSSFALARMEDTFEAELVQEESQMLDDDFDLQVSFFAATSQPVKRFVDSHLRWNLGATSFKSRDTEENVTDADETGSIDSDDYGFIFRPLSTDEEDASNLPRSREAPPLMIVTSSFDAVQARMRNLDDAVGHALSSGRGALALKRALRQRRRLRRFKINQLVDEYFISLLRIPRDNIAAESEERQHPPLSVRRLKLAASAMPVLFGAEVSLWERWTHAVEKIPGALFVLGDYIPVRDPKLPKETYHSVLRTMLQEIYLMSTVSSDSSDDDAASVVARAEQTFLNTLIGWGPTNFLKEHIKFCKFNGSNRRTSSVIRDAEDRFSRRFTQSSAGYLNFPVSHGGVVTAEAQIESEGYYDSRKSLFDVDEVISMTTAYAPIVSDYGSTSTEGDATQVNNSRVALEALAKLNMMRGQYNAAMKCFMYIAALHSSRSFSEFESGAVEFSDSDREIDKPWKSENGLPYTYLLEVIDSHHLQQCLLNVEFGTSSQSTRIVPLFSLLQLVGFEELGKFLIEHCVPPERSDGTNSPSRPTGEGGLASEERRSTLPLDLVAAQLEASPRILHWYLHLVFKRKPEVYVRFRHTAYPPRAVTELHRRHFALYVQFSGRERDSALVLSGIEAYKVSGVETRVLRFLKATLPLGGIRPQDAKRALESERSNDDDEMSSAFALELAFIMEHYGEETEMEAQHVLDLYMKGAKSLVLAVAFAQRNTSYSAQLWRSLIKHCLDSEFTDGEVRQRQLDGSLFGELLEGAALCGADLAKLVTQIPTGMAIEGLRPRLVAAVADYRLKLRMHEAASEVATKDMISVLRELSHRSRRGVRYKSSLPADGLRSPGTPEVLSGGEDVSVHQRLLPQRPIERQDRYKLGVPLPIR